MSAKAVSERVREAIEHYRRGAPYLVPALNLYARLFDFQEAVRSRLGPYPLHPNPEADLRAEKALFAGEAPPAEPREVVRAAEGLCRVLGDSSGEGLSADTILALPELQPQAIPALLRALAQERERAVLDLSSRSGLPARLLAFFFSNLIVPFYAHRAASYQSLLGGVYWGQGVCPICGQPARLGRLRKEDGSRLLFCSLCRVQWRFPLLKCPHCGNIDQGRLRYFYAERLAHRVEVCDVCQTYVKTSDERALEREVALPVEDLVTVELDYLAIREGFHCPT